MKTEHLQRVHELFDAALKEPAEGRAAFLAKACGGDDGLRQEVEALLRHDSAVGDDFLRPPDLSNAVLTGALVAAEQPDPLIGQRIGRYHVKGVIGRGGMATVYEAVQEQPHRVVALKLMHRNVPSRSALRRFEFEAQVLGRLRHPNVAQIYEAGMYDPAGRASVPAEAGRDAGPTDPNRDRKGVGAPTAVPGPLAYARGSDPGPLPYGRGSDPLPYFAMEYIPGARDLIAYATDKQLNTRQRLELFAPVCDAVQHGHQKGIIHRDVKPTNILVGADGVPKVIDFGVARGTDSDMAVTTQQTNLGQLVGTLQYMSPEQCDGDPHEIDARSDVYSLGVVLYELLTGCVPYDATKSTIYQATRIVKEAQPQRPSAVVGERQKGVRNLLPRSGPAGAGHKRFLTPFSRELRGDLDTIVLKALEKDRDKRYGSAADLAQDIRRHLSGEPIEARPATAWSHGLRWATRHPVWVTAAACFLLATCTTLATVGTVSMLWNRPGSIVMRPAPDEQVACLVSVGGNVLHTWGVPNWEVERGSATFVRFVALRDQPARLGGRRLALIGFHAESLGGRHPSTLCAFDLAGDLDTPIWQGQVEDTDIPARLKARTDYAFAPETFRVARGLAADVFPELPGEELIVVHQHAHTTHSAIHVYDLAGTVLYQVWADAEIVAVYWMSGPGLLVLAGVNGEAYWEDRGEYGCETGHPKVVFALRPERGFRTRDYVAQEPAAQEGVDPRLRPVWYRCLLPAAPSAQAVHFGLYTPDRSWNKAECVTFNIDIEARYPSDRVGVSLVLNKDGDAVDGPVLEDCYKRNQTLSDDDSRRLPAIDWQLGPLPPIRGSTGETPVLPG